MTDNNTQGPTMTDNNAQDTTNTDNAPYCVEWWGSNPQAGNDDLWMGGDYMTLQEAQEAYTATENAQDPAFRYIAREMPTVAYIVLRGPSGLHKMRKNPHFKPSTDTCDDEWKREMATEAGMLGGCDAYNDYMGY